MPIPSVSVVIPTIDGREDLAGRAVEAFGKTPNTELVLVKNRATCGEGWNDGVAKATGEYVLLAADDVIPMPGWELAAIAAIDCGFYPAPIIRKGDAWGDLEAAGSMGGGMKLEGDVPADWLPVVSSPFPFWKRSEFPECLPIHYYADDWLAFCAAVAGRRAVLRHGFVLQHLEGTVGRQRVVNRAMDDRDLFLQAVAKTTAPTWATPDDGA